MTMGGRWLIVGLGAAALAGFLVAAGVFRHSTAQDTEMNPSELQGRWTLESIDGEKVETAQDVFFEIRGENLTGFDGCNSFGGPLGAPERIRSGQRSCVGDYVALPLDLSDPLAQLSAAQLGEGDRLTVPLAGDRGVAVLRREPPG
jgi:META domain